MVLTLEDHESRLVLDLDEVVVVKLDCLPGAGYAWQLADGELDLVEVVGQPYFEPKAAEEGGEESLGGEKLQVFHLRGRKVGSGALELHYGRPWEEEEEPNRVFRITVEVAEPPDER